MRTDDYLTSSHLHFARQHELAPVQPSSFFQPESLRERISKIAAIITGAAIIGVGMVGMRIAAEDINVIPSIMGNSVIFGGIVSLIARGVMDAASRIFNDKPLSSSALIRANLEAIKDLNHPDTREVVSSGPGYRAFMQASKEKHFPPHRADLFNYLKSLALPSFDSHFPQAIEELSKEPVNCQKILDILKKEQSFIKQVNHLKKDTFMASVINFNEKGFASVEEYLDFYVHELIFCHYAKEKPEIINQKTILNHEESITNYLNNLLDIQKGHNALVQGMNTKDLNHVTELVKNAILGKIIIPSNKDEEHLKTASSDELKFLYLDILLRSLVGEAANYQTINDYFDSSLIPSSEELKELTSKQLQAKLP